MLTLLNNKKLLRGLRSIGLIFFSVFFCFFILSFILTKPEEDDLEIKLKKFGDIEFVEKPNIYLICYDGIPNRKVFDIYDLPLEKLQSLLDQYDFKIYDDVYTLGEHSLNSLGMTLNITNERIDDGQARDIYSGNSFVNHMLRKKGYTTHKFLREYYTGAGAIKNADLVDRFYPERRLWEVNTIFFVTLIRGVFQGEFRFDTRGLTLSDKMGVPYSLQDIQDDKNKLMKQPKEKHFIVDHYPFPGHTQFSGRYRPGERERWIERFEFTLKQIEKDFEIINTYDPDALVIVLSDHGPYLGGDHYRLTLYTGDDIIPDLVWSRIGTLAAIRWPDKERAKKYDSDLVVNQDVFPIVFSYLTDNQSFLDLKVDRTFKGLHSPFRPDIRFYKGEVNP